MRRVLSHLFWPFLALTCIVNYAIALVIWLVTTPFDRQRRINHLWSCFWAWIYAVAVPNWKVRITGRERIERGRTYVLIANHTSIADIVFCFIVFRQFKWVSKASVFRTPFLGWNMYLCRYVPLVRGDGESIRKMLAACRDWLRQGMSIMMFPEGTRSTDGQLKPFKPGAFTLAYEAGVPVVPIAIHGGHNLIPKHGTRFSSMRGDLLVEVLDPISPADYPDAQALSDAARHRIATALGQTN
jgi:1-acyl-sn-glycerol-3-phosphate acyltransferase